MDPVDAAARCVRAIKEGKTRSVGGKDIAVGADAICVHSDTPNAVEVAIGGARRGQALSGRGLNALF